MWWPNILYANFRENNFFSLYLRIYISYQDRVNRHSEFHQMKYNTTNPSVTITSYKAVTFVVHFQKRFPCRILTSIRRSQIWGATGLLENNQINLLILRFWWFASNCYFFKFVNMITFFHFLPVQYLDKRLVAIPILF